MSQRNGFGHIYKRGLYYWIKYYSNGAPIYESSKSEKESDAKALLKKRLAEAVSGTVTSAHVTVDELLNDCLAFYQTNRKSADSFASSYIGKLKKSWAKYKVAQVTTGKLIAYQKRRLSDGVAPATINREMALLRRAFNLGHQATPIKVHIVPKFPMLPEAKPRRGFLEPHQYDALMEKLADELKPLLVVAYHTGARKAELLSLKWSQVSMEDRAISLWDTKNDEPRMLPIYGDMVVTLENQKAACPKRCPWVFHRAGKPIRNFRAAWAEACKAAKLPGLLFHDLRRSAVRNMVRSGVKENVAMKISGHKTRAVFDRYNITSRGDLEDAGQKLAAFLENKR